jgi:hypothetical protein
MEVVVLTITFAQPQQEEQLQEAAVGRCVGAPVGSSEGMMVVGGDDDGASVGASEGLLDGASVGAAVGRCVGAPY